MLTSWGRWFLSDAQETVGVELAFPCAERLHLSSVGGLAGYLWVCSSSDCFLQKHLPFSDSPEPLVLTLRTCEGLFGVHLPVPIVLAVMFKDTEFRQDWIQILAM